MCVTILWAILSILSEWSFRLQKRKTLDKGGERPGGEGGMRWRAKLFLFLMGYDVIQEWPKNTTYVLMLKEEKERERKGERFSGGLLYLCVKKMNIPILKNFGKKRWTFFKSTTKNGFRCLRFSNKTTQIIFKQPSFLMSPLRQKYFAG